MKKILNILKNENGFMGPTHSLSAVAFYFILIALLPAFIFDTILGTKNVLILLGSIFIITGASLLPDFDNSRSTVISQTGLLGKLISKTMRAFALVVYNATKTKRDEHISNPHRTFWHTLISAFFVGFIIFIMSAIPISINLPIIDKTVTVGYIFTVLYIYLCYQLTLVSFWKTIVKNSKKNIIGKVIIIVSGIIFSVGLLVAVPDSFNISWIVMCTILGYIFHIIGDTFTVAGTPLLWPLKHKGKRWWNYRFAKIKAGGEFENKVLVPLFSVLILVSIFYILFLQ